MAFLNAEWRKLILVNYEVDPAILRPYLPAKTELDLYKGKCLISLVGFMFVDTKIVGLRIPFHINFEEVNLRFYVKYKTNNGPRRGVVFIKEIVPKRAISLVANLIYKEHYETCKMDHGWNLNDNEIEVDYRWKKKGKWQHFSVQASNKPLRIDLDSDIAFISEHYWGYTRINEEKSFEYEVKHPVWQVYPVLAYEINVDFGLVYGNNFGFLSNTKPTSIMLAEGSEITVEKAKRI